MRQRQLVLALSLSTLALAACAPRAEQVASAPKPRPVWAFTQSDVPLDPGFTFGQLPNGMRYAIRANATPKGTALVRMQIDAGALDEADAERGFAHFVEHMAFNGSTNVPEGEMIKLLERHGLAFGADTNAATGFDTTTYRLDLPKSDEELLGIALMLMRETVSELRFDPGAVERERGVILSEKRDRDGYQIRNYLDQIEFLHPGAHYVRRLPIGTDETLKAASADALKRFWRREYVPRQTTLIVVGDFDAAKVEAAIRARFGDWRPAPTEPPAKAGPFPAKDTPRTDIHIDPALAEHVSATRTGPWLDEPDSLAQRRENLLRQVGYGIVNRRLLSRAREANAPFRNAGFSTSELFREARLTRLGVDTVDGKWRRGLVEAAEEYRRALAYGFTPAEVAEQVANIRTASRNAAAGEATRDHAALVGAVLALINDDRVPDTPRRSLERLEAFIPEITPVAVLAALKREALPLDEPLLRFQGRTPPGGGEAGLRAAWREAMAKPLARGTSKAASAFAYTDFGAPGRVVSDNVEPQLGIRTLRFANNVRLNLKRTDLQQDRVLVQLSVDGGNMLATKDNPLATRMVSVLALGGLGKHSKDELDTLLAGRTVSSNVSATDETFTAIAATTPQDLDLQLQLLAAQVTDPGYRREGQVLYLQTINNMFASLRATPGSALSADLGAILSDNDPRFSLGKVEAFRALTFDKLKADISERLTNGAIEIGLVGDFEDDKAIALVARTFGALPPREPEFRAWADRRDRPFTASNAPRVLRHTGLKDQALVTVHWKTRDASDPAEALALELLGRVVRLEMTEVLREKLGKAYSPSAGSAVSFTWKDYGTFTVNASVAVNEVPAARAAIAEALAGLRARAIDPDLLLRARAPMLEDFDNALKTNAGWLALVDRAQTEPDRIERYVKGKDRLLAITPAQLQALAARYLTSQRAVEVTVLPEGVDPVQPTVSR
ncbi:M16 family metallopeptidase [Novosphingobium sp.]|uniref:M16 family metallopeptidase n=1 Tax=Novosphingobium sp. TaxID=1874826 RepID=UPI001ECB240B|nr:M16 family metallopeptidase [Novosphingobium sp.]MBK6801807.1 insulinase family protein [Novosphingobium sp.]MBK9010353.1 insulinase family protein [Novosphingobium sp.]